VWLDESDGMRMECAVNLDTIQNVHKEKLGKVISHLSDERMREVRGAIEFVFDLKNL
jgi:mRNA-degrading endonuclease toxin of MazEF toxin-antitoxin module